MSSGRATMQRWIVQLRTLPQGIEAAAPRIAERMGQLLRADYAAQRAPDGTPWEPAKDGRTMMQSAPGALDTFAKGATVTARLTSRNLFRHHIGVANGAPRRQMIPSGKTPETVSQAIADELTATFGKHMGGR